MSDYLDFTDVRLKNKIKNPHDLEFLIDVVSMMPLPMRVFHFESLIFKANADLSAHSIKAVRELNEQNREAYRMLEISQRRFKAHERYHKLQAAHRV